MNPSHERALSFLHQQLEWTKRFERQQPPGAAEREGRTAGVLNAFTAVGVITAEERLDWQRRLGGAEEVVQPSDEERQRADELLAELVEAVPTDTDDTDGVEFNRFEGATVALDRVGIATEEWDARLRQRLGWPTAEEEWAQTRALNAGGTQQDLLAVVPGPSEPSTDGVRVLFVLRFADGLSFVVNRERADHEDWPLMASLCDNVGTEYQPGGMSGGDGDFRVSFRTPAPDDATWVELSGVAAEPIRVEL